jgi:hypothetical protein
MRGIHLKTLDEPAIACYTAGTFMISLKELAKLMGIDTSRCTRIPSGMAVQGRSLPVFG